jgi:hypothetical protein
VKKHAGRPFTILGVNCDRDRGELKKMLEKERITWRSFWDGDGGGPARRALAPGPPGDRAEALAKLKREVNAAVGRFALRSGATLPLKRIDDDQANEFDICDVRGKTCF